MLPSLLVMFVTFGIGSVLVLSAIGLCFIAATKADLTRREAIYGSAGGLLFFTVVAGFCLFSDSVRTTLQVYDRNYLESLSRQVKYHKE